MAGSDGVLSEAWAKMYRVCDRKVCDRLRPPTAGGGGGRPGRRLTATMSEPASVEWAVGERRRQGRRGARERERCRHGEQQARRNAMEVPSAEPVSWKTTSGSAMKNRSQSRLSEMSPAAHSRRKLDRDREGSAGFHFDSSPKVGRGNAARGKLAMAASRVVQASRPRWRADDGVDALDDRAQLLGVDPDAVLSVGVDIAPRARHAPSMRSRGRAVLYERELVVELDGCLGASWRSHSRRRTGHRSRGPCSDPSRWDDRGRWRPSSSKGLTRPPHASRAPRRSSLQLVVDATDCRPRPWRTPMRSPVRETSGS